MGRPKGNTSRWQLRDEAAKMRIYNARMRDKLTFPEIEERFKISWKGAKKIIAEIKEKLAPASLENCENLEVVAHPSLSSSAARED